MIMSYNETKRLVEFVLTQEPEFARKLLHLELLKINRSEPEFCAGVLEHGRALPYTAEQWFDFLSKVPNRLFREERWLTNKLTEKHREVLQLED